MPFPKRLVPVEPPDEGDLLPKRLGYESRVRNGTRELGGLTVALRTTEHPSVPQQEGLSSTHEAAELVVQLRGRDPMQALQEAQPIIEFVIDRLSFDLQAPLYIGQTEVIDVTPPVEVGEQREMLVFAGYPLDKFARSVDVGAAQTDPTPALLDSYGDPSSKGRQALRWYVKALGTPFLQDQFIFLWIASEIFADHAGIEVREPRRMRCGHVIGFCPQCGRETDDKVRGESMKKYLVARRATEELAKEAWALRQMMHGAIPFDSERLAGLPAVIQVLRTQVVAEIKTAFGIAEDRLPVVSAGVVSIHPTMGVGGSRAITAADLEELEQGSFAA